MSPSDVAWDALQKEEQGEEEEDFQLYDDDGNLHPNYVMCPTCYGQGYRDEGSGDPYHGGETCYHCYGHGVVHRTEEENRPIDDLMRDFAANPTPETKQSVNQYFAEEPEMVFPENFSNLMTGEPMDLTWRLLKNYKSQDFIFNPDYGASGYYDPNSKEHFVNLAQMRALDEQGAIEGITRIGTHEAIHAAQDSELQHLRGEDGKGHFSAHEVGAHSAQDPYEMQDWRNWRMSEHGATNPDNFETLNSGESPSSPFNKIRRKTTNPNTISDVTPRERIYGAYEDDDEFEDYAFDDHDFALMSNWELSQWLRALRDARSNDEPDDEMKNDPYYRFLLGSRGSSPYIRGRLEDELERRNRREPDLDGGYRPKKFEPDFQDKLASEPMDLAWRLLKEDPLDPEERTPIDDEKIQYKFPSAGPYWTLNDRQKKVADATLDLPSAYLSEEGWDGYDFDHLFAEGHETVSDQEYERLEAALRYYKRYIQEHMAHPDTDKSPQFLDEYNSDHPEHPWARARHMAFFRETEPYDHFSEDFKEANKSEPMDIAMRLLKAPDDFDKIQDDIERSKTEGRRSFPEGRKKQRSMGSGSTEEEHEPRERPNARNRAPSLEDTEAFYDSLELHPGSRGHEINTLRNEAGPRSHPAQFGTFMPIDDKEWIWEEAPEDLLPERPAIGPDDRIRNVALQRESLKEVPTFAQAPFNPLTGFTRSEPMDIAMQLLKESVQTKLPGGYDNPRPAASIRRSHNRKSEGRAQPARLHVDDRIFSLLDNDGNILSSIENENMTGAQEIGSNIIEDYYGLTPEENRRKGYYKDLIEAALRHGYKINSDSRNEPSNEFHKKFLTNLPPDIEAEAKAAPDPISGKRPVLGDLGPHNRIKYSGKYAPGNAIGWGDLQTDSRSKVPMTYVTDFQRYQNELNEGIDANRDIKVRGPDGVKNYVQSRLDLSMEKPVPRWGGMMAMNRSGGEAWHGDGRVPMLPTNQGIGVPTGTSYNPAFFQSDRPQHDINFSPSVNAGVVGINPRRLTRQMHALPFEDMSF